MDFEAKILIIDDEEIVLDSCERILAGRNYEIFTAPNGTVGLETLKNVHPDLIFVDLKMPGISGFDVLEGIQSIDPNIVCIVITGFATVSSAIEAMKKGAYDFLPKPFTPDELRLITKRGVDRRKLVLETIALRREKEMLRENFAAIINPGESAILAISSVTKTPVVREDHVVVRSIMKMTLSADHRLVDGALGARFINAVKDKLEDLELWKRLT